MRDVLGNSASNLFGSPETIILPAMEGEFVAREHFVENIKRDARVRISHLGARFRRHYLEGEGKVEKPLDCTVLLGCKLLVPAIDASILETVGGENRSKTFLRQLFWLLEKQPIGQNGPLQAKLKLLGGSGSIFYVPDSEGVMRNVLVSWQPDGWLIGALEIATVRSRFNEWEFGNKIFFPGPHPFNILV